MPRGSALLIALMLACSGCGHRAATALPNLEMPECPAPAAPILPHLDPYEPLDSPANVKVIMERDDIIRAYIDGLTAALACYGKRRKAKGGRENGSE